MDASIAAIATGQEGLVSREQLAALGLGRGAIRHRLACGRLHRIHQGVYAVGHRRLTDEGRWLAGVLAAGEEAVLSHRAAAALWEIWPRTVVAEVTAPRSKTTCTGLRVHHGVLAPDEVTARGGIPVTTAARTLLDLAAVVDERQLRKAWREAEFRRLVDVFAVDHLLCRYPGRRGVAKLRKTLRAVRPGEFLRSDLEDRFRRFVARHGLPRPAYNQKIDLGTRIIEADAVWHDARLIVELDGRSAHDTGSAFESDRERDRAALLAGWRVVRVTWAQIAAPLARDLRALLDAHRGSKSV